MKHGANVRIIIEISKYFAQNPRKRRGPFDPPWLCRVLEGQLHGLAGDPDALLALAGKERGVEHDVAHHAFHDAAQGAGAGARLAGLLGDGVEGFPVEVEPDAVRFQQGRVLAHERVLGLGQDLLQGLRVQGLHIGDHWESAHELGDEPIGDQVAGPDLSVQAALRQGSRRLFVKADALRALPDASGDDLVDADERAGQDEEDVLRVDADAIRIRVLPPALGLHAHDIPLYDLQEGLLDALAGHVAGDGRVLVLLGDLVAFVQHHDAVLRPGDIIVAVAEQAHQALFHVRAHIPARGELRAVLDMERDVQQLREGLDEVRLAAARLSEQDDVGLLQLHVAGAQQAVRHALVVVVGRHGEGDLRLLLADDVLVQAGLDLVGPQDLEARVVHCVVLGIAFCHRQMGLMV